jgi:hypothetical protein
MIKMQQYAETVGGRKSSKHDIESPDKLLEIYRQTAPREVQQIDGTKYFLSWIQKPERQTIISLD